MRFNNKGSNTNKRRKTKIYEEPYRLFNILERSLIHVEYIKYVNTPNRWKGERLVTKEEVQRYR